MAISTTQAIEALHCMRDRERWNDFRDVTIGDTVQRMFYMGVLEMAIDALKKQQWIPCSIALPQEDGEYLVTIHWENGGYYTDLLRYKAYLKEWKDEDKIFGTVMAWQPKPQPWEGNRNE